MMVVGLRKSQDEDEREKGVQLLVRVTCKREWFSEEQCSKAKKWELELQGTRLRQAARQDGGGDGKDKPRGGKGRRGDRNSSGGRRRVSEREGETECCCGMIVMGLKNAFFGWRLRWVSSEVLRTAHIIHTMESSDLRWRGEIESTSSF